MNKEKFYVSNGEQYWEFSNVREIFHYKSLLQPISFQVIGHNFNDTYTEASWPEPRVRIKVKYVVYDYLWRVVRKEVLKELYDNTPPVRIKQYGRWFFSDKNYPGFRKGPVPHTGRKSFGFYNWYRMVQTTQERKWNCAHKKYTRGKRRNIRTAWDDIPRADRDIKQSWKKQKKRKQWL